MTIDDLDPRTPVLVGVGEASERIDDDGYRGMSAVDLAAQAALAALDDAGVTDALGGLPDSDEDGRARVEVVDRHPRIVTQPLSSTPRPPSLRSATRPTCVSDSRESMSDPRGTLDHVLLPDDDTCYRAVTSKDPRFDGWFFTAVRTTGIYCRPSCPAITPLRRNVTFHASAAAAQRAGYRACKRCRPDAAPGSPEWNIRGDLAGRALRLISDGIVDRGGVPELARRLGYSERQVHRTLVAEVGAGPLALARSQRAQTARVLLETTAMPITDIAFAAGFASVRQFNDTVREVFATSPTALRTAGRGPHPGGAGTITLRLPYREPMTPSSVLDLLGAHAVPGLESYRDGVFERVLTMPGGPAFVRLAPGEGAVSCEVRLRDTRDLVAVVARVRRLLDLDADPVACDAVLGADPQLAALITKRPGIRSPGSVDGFETAVRTVVGQQISVSGARTVLGRIVEAHGTPTDPAPDAGAGTGTGTGDPAVTWRTFPTAEVLAGIDPESLPMPRARGRSVVALARAFAEGGLELDPGSDRDEVRAQLLALPGVGPWTADYLLMRATGHPDVLLTSDLVVRRGAADLGIDLAGGRNDWAPWRSYVTYHLWAHLYADLWSVAP